MRITVAPDSFKESMSAVTATEAIARGLRNAIPNCEIIGVPMADGGEGTVEALVAATDGQFHTAKVTGPLGGQVDARYGTLGEGETGVIEMAAASGLPLVPPDKRNPLITTTFGTGELIRNALDIGARKIIVGIGGSATVDGGAGMAQALGAELLDEKGKPLKRGGGSLKDLANIDLTQLDPRLKDTQILVASDVTNPLCGKHGAARIYGPQKGATPEMVMLLDQSLGRLAQVIESDLGLTVKDTPGAGAAGGLGAGLIAFLGATIRPGIELIIEAVGLRERMAGSAWTITGEGRLDASSVYGKTAVGVAKVAKSLGIPVIALVGSVGEGAEAIHEHGVDAYFSIMSRPMTIEEAFREGETLLEKLASEVGRTVCRNHL